MHRSRRLLSLPLATLSVLFASVFSFGATVSAQSVVEPRPLSVNEQIIQQHAYEMAEKSGQLSLTSAELEQLEAKKANLTTQLETEKKMIEELKQKIADKKAADERAKAEAARVQAAPVVRTASAPVASGQGLMSGCGDNSYAAYIYGQESGGRVTGMCNPSAVNAGGCRGIGQACPGGKLPCGADYACQNAWFNDYAIRAYGSWAAAYNFHKNNGWW